MQNTDSYTNLTSSIAIENQDFNFNISLDNNEEQLVE